MNVHCMLIHTKAPVHPLVNRHVVVETHQCSAEWQEEGKGKGSYSLPQGPERIKRCKKVNATKCQHDKRADRKVQNCTFSLCFVHYWGSFEIIWAEQYRGMNLLKVRFLYYSSAILFPRTWHHLWLCVAIDFSDRKHGTAREMSMLQSMNIWSCL